MLNTLIVDDEKLVRKGLISTMPWEKYGIRIIGEAGNGRAALDFMQKHDVDLLFVDLTMPTMNGFELMKAVRMRDPKTWIVVLTCHQDFDYIQEAMRAGAIDYIVKTQMDKESMDDILARIVERIRYDQGSKATSSGAQTPKTAPRRIFLLALMSANKDKESASNLLKASVPSATPYGDRIWSIACTDDETESSLRRFAAQSDDFVLVIVHGEPHISAASIWNYLFYEYEPNRSAFEWADLPAKAAGNQTRDETKRLEEHWFLFRWLYDEEQWRLAIALIEQTRPDSRLVTEMFRLSVSLWRQMFRSSGGPDPYERLPESLLSWRDTKQVLDELRSELKQRMKGSAYFIEIIVSILKSLYYLSQLDDLRVNRDLVAAKFNMSSGYFSECFKTIVGKSFGEYVREMQIEKAKRLLVETSDPIYRIADRTGYKDEKYFSKIFRERVGINPAEYRKAAERIEQAK